MKRRIALILGSWIAIITLQGGCAIQSAPLDVHATSGAPKTEIRLITYNIHRGVGLDKKSNLLEIREIIRPYDVICLNEVGHEQARWLAESLQRSWVSTGRNAVLSRVPIRSCRVHKLPMFLWIAERRTVIEAELEGGFTVFAAHTGLIPIERDIHLACLKKLADRRPGPRVICGDFNCAPHWNAVRDLRHDYVDAADHGITHQTWPRLRIDYILASPDVLIRRSARGRSSASDHLPLSATLEKVQ